MREDEDWQSALTWMILPVGRIWYRAVSNAFVNFGMSFSTAAPILAISKLGDGSRQNVIAKAIGVDNAAMVRSIDELESLGLVERRDDPDDRRAKALFLTKKGRVLAKELGSLAEDIRKRALADVTAASGKAAVSVLRNLERAAATMLMGDKHASADMQSNGT